MMRFIALGGFLGAGKTTTMLAAAELLEAAGERVIVITNDQGVDLVDSQLARDVAVTGHGEVTGGCFCCRFDDLVAVVRRLAEARRPTVVLAEAVGSCTDLQSTVVRPLRRLYGDDLRVSPLTVVVDPHRYRTVSRAFDTDAEPDLAYLYRHQLDEADIIAINKADLIGVETAGVLRADIRRRFPGARVVVYSAATGDGLAEMLALWERRNGDPFRRPFPIDYDRYGAAEAELAWCNQTLSLTAPREFSLSQWVRAFLRTFSEACERADAIIGHVKLRVSSSAGAVKASLVDAGAEACHDEEADRLARHGEVTLNARVQTSPEVLGAIVDRATSSACASVGCLAGPREGEIFRPGFPVPVFRM